MSASGQLGAYLKPAEAKRLADAWKQTPGVLHVVVKAVDTPRRDEARALLRALSDEVQQDAGAVSAVLRAVAAVEQTAPPRLVWTSPSLPGIEGQTTLAVAALINEAQEVVYAATYSATLGSPYVTALAKALERGVKTLILDKAQQAKASRVLAAKLPDARLWTLAPPEDGGYAVQHAKIVMVEIGWLCSSLARTSPTAAAETNLEVPESSFVITGRRGPVKSHLDTLHSSGFLVDYDD